MKTYSQLQTEIFKAQDELRKLQYKLSNNNGYEFIKAVEAKLESDFFMSPAEAAGVLAEELTERDWPMTRSEIVEVFDFSGYPYTDAIIDLARPDCQEAVNEEAARYADCRDFGRDQS